MKGREDDKKDNEKRKTRKRSGNILSFSS